jgi:hypothetical protein
MSLLSATEKVKLEKLLRMSSGYVWNFSDKTFRTFIADIVGLDIHDQKYQGSGTSRWIHPMVCRRPPWRERMCEA